MRPSAIISPFAAIEIGDDWVQWSKDQPLSSLQNGKQVECWSNPDYQDDTGTAGTAPLSLPYIMPIQRSQYNAVLDRFANARKRSGAFSNWVT